MREFLEMMWVLAMMVGLALLWRGLVWPHEKVRQSARTSTPADPWARLARDYADFAQRGAQLAARATELAKQDADKTWITSEHVRKHASHRARYNELYADYMAEARRLATRIEKV